MAYVKVENGIIVQKQPNTQEGFIEAPDDVVCGMVKDGKEFKNPDIVVTWDKIRSKRDGLLAISDWTQLPDAPDANKTEWADYRQKLRDITDDFDNPSDVVFPDAPEV